MTKEEAHKICQRIRQAGDTAMISVGLFGLTPQDTEKIGIEYIRGLYEKGYDDDDVRTHVIARAKELNKNC